MTRKVFSICSSDAAIVFLFNLFTSKPRLISNFIWISFCDFCDSGQICETLSRKTRKFFIRKKLSYKNFLDHRSAKIYLFFFIYLFIYLLLILFSFFLDNWSFYVNINETKVLHGVCSIDGMENFICSW